jgi:hypothetical protein
MFQDAIEFELQVLLGYTSEIILANKLSLFNKDWREALRLCCIFSIVNQILSANTTENINRRMFQKYGLNIVKDLENLQNIDLLYQSEGFLENFYKNNILTMHMSSENNSIKK